MSPSSVLMEAAGHWSTWPAHQVPLHLDDVIMGFQMFLFFHFPLRSWPFMRSPALMWSFLPWFPGRRRSSSLTAILTFLTQQGISLRRLYCDCVLTGLLLGRDTFRVCGVGGEVRGKSGHEMVKERAKQFTKFNDFNVSPDCGSVF